MRGSIVRQGIIVSALGLAIVALAGLGLRSVMLFEPPEAIVQRHLQSHVDGEAVGSLPVTRDRKGPATTQPSPIDGL